MVALGYDSENFGEPTEIVDNIFKRKQQGNKDDQNSKNIKIE